MKIACASIIDHLRPAAEFAAKAGFDGLSLQSPVFDVRTLSTTGRREIRHVLAQRNLAAAALRYALPGKGLTPAVDADRVLDSIGPLLELARDCGFAMVVCDLGTLPRAPTEVKKRAPIDPLQLGALILPDATDSPDDNCSAPLTESEQAHAAFVTDVLREIGALVDRIGIPAALGASLASTDDLVAALTSAACPMFFREIDPSSVIDEVVADVDSVVKRMPPALHVVARDAQSSGNRSRAATVGTGDVPWSDLADSLMDAGFAGFVTCPGALDDAAKCLDFLRQE